MAYETPLTIAEVMKDISANKYVLPSIQRDYVWSTEQIETLFDSLMRDYPIGTFLFWEISKEHVCDYDFYEKIILQNQPLSIHTLVNKYYQLPLSYEPDDLVEINDTSLHYGAKYSKHTARKIVYDDFQALVHSCQKQGFELYVCSGYLSSTWQKDI